VTGFRTLGGGFTLAKQSTARMAWTAKALYVAVDCEEPDIGLIDDRGKDGGSLWLDNGIEMFLRLPESVGVLQFIVNTIGSRAMGEGRDTVGLDAWRAAAMKGEGFWSMEAEIPFACLRAAPDAGSLWRTAVCRNIVERTSGGDRFTSWPGLRARFREPENFAVLEFRGQSLSLPLARNATAELNRPYHGVLLHRVEELAQAGAEYQAPIAEAVATPAFATEARQLNETWERIRRFARDAANADVRELRELSAVGDELIRQSYGLKYRFLIEKLLAD